MWVHAVIHHYGTLEWAAETPIIFFQKEEDARAAEQYLEAFVREKMELFKRNPDLVDFNAALQELLEKESLHLSANFEIFDWENDSFTVTSYKVF